MHAILAYGKPAPAFPAKTKLIPAAMTTDDF